MIRTLTTVIFLAIAASAYGASQQAQAFAKRLLISMYPIAWKATTRM